MLQGRQWDAVIDTCGYFAQDISALVPVLGGAHYTFISTVSVYREWGKSDQDESSPTAEPLGGTEQKPGAYGGLKIACENAARRAKEALIIRPGLIIGPFDPTDRFTYWPSRLALGGSVLAPGNPNRAVQVIDARDLASWMVVMAEKRETGTFNACADPIPMRKLLNACRKVARRDTRFTWVSDQFLIDNKVTPYAEMPLWIPGVDDSFSTAAARSQGLACRLLEETVRDVLLWDRSRLAAARVNGLKPERERELLELWRQESICF